MQMNVEYKRFEKIFNADYQQARRIKSIHKSIRQYIEWMSSHYHDHQEFLDYLDAFHSALYQKDEAQARLLITQLERVYFGLRYSNKV